MKYKIASCMLFFAFIAVPACAEPTDATASRTASSISADGELYTYKVATDPVDWDWSNWQEVVSDCRIHVTSKVSSKPTKGKKAPIQVAGGLP